MTSTIRETTTTGGRVGDSAIRPDGVPKVRTSMS